MNVELLFNRMKYGAIRCISKRQIPFDAYILWYVLQQAFRKL